MNESFPLLGFIIGCMLCVGASAHDDGRYANSPDKAWFESQRAANGMPCCELADGHRLDDVDWDADSDGNYRVRISGQWVTVPKQAVINPKDRPTDQAIVWYMQSGTSIHIWCFMPGAGV